MPARERLVFVVSDLHLGGRPPDPARPGDPGFRMFSHGDALAAFIGALAARPAAGPAVELVINGDFVDFLAEWDEAAGGWTALREDQDLAALVLRDVMAREVAVFDALATLLARGHRLTVLLGNHDIELSYPAVRATFAERLGAAASSLGLQFVFDGEAYVVGDALIEHGNRYDAFNQVDHGALRRVRSLMSRRQSVPEVYRLTPPPGSELVARLMNPIKERYRFVDLLKPEDGAAVPILLALEPASWAQLRTFAGRVRDAATRGLVGPALPLRPGDIADVAPAAGGAPGGALLDFDGPAPPSSSPPAGDLADDLDALLAEDLTPAARARVRADLGLEPFAAADRRRPGGDISDPAAKGGRLRWLGGIAELLARRDPDLDARLPALLGAIRIVQHDRGFDLDVETSAKYRNAAETLSRGDGEDGAPRFRVVVFGHTHKAKDLVLATGARYLNTGTWADLMMFPRELLRGPDDNAMVALRAFVEEVHAGRIDRYVTFRPTYARLRTGPDGRIVEAGVHEFRDDTNV